MDLVRTSIDKPVAVAVGVILVVMFGLIGLGAIPIQLTPTIDRAVLTVTTRWAGRSPQEVMDEITKEQEERLKSVSNLKSMRSLSAEGQATVTLEFYVGTDMAGAKQDVADALRQVPSYPEQVDEPTIKATEGAAENAIAWVIIDLDPAVRDRFPDFDIATVQTRFVREVKPFLERIDGVAEVNVFGGREREARVLVDPVALAQRGLSHGQVIAALRSENQDVSGGTIAEGKRDYRVRVVGQFESSDDILNTIIAYRPAAGDPTGAPVPVYVRDVGTVEIGYVKARGFVRNRGEPSLAMNLIRQSGANVIDVMSELRQRLDEVRSDILPGLDPQVGPYLRMHQVYDETTYIGSAIDLVRTNLWRGGTLAILALLVFLRSIRATMVVAMAIPISLVGTFLVMLVTGRSLNVVSLAGLAFATGMVVDNAVVVLENIDRRRALGDSPADAVYRGTKEVWGAILAATLTTVAVFVPILTIQEEAGQLFFDLTLALATSVTLSLVVAITVIPSASNLLLGRVTDENDGHHHPLRNLLGLTQVAHALVVALSRGMYWLMTGWRAWSLRPLVIVVLTVASIVGAIALAPPLDYLPAGNRNLVFGGLAIPPGLSVDQRTQYAQRIERSVEPYVDVQPGDTDRLATLEKIPRPWGDEGEPFDPVGIENFFIGSFGGGMFVGATSTDPQVVLPIASLVTNAMNRIPDAFGGAQQSSVFGRGVGGGNTINVEISGPDLDRVKVVAQQMFETAGRKYGYDKLRTDPANFNLSQMEYRVRLTDAGRELGLTTQSVGTAVRGLFDGAFAGDYRFEGRKIDLVVLPSGGRLDYKEQLASIPVATPAGRVVPIDSIVDVTLAPAPQQIQRIEELPSVTLRITPPQGRALESVMGEVDRDVIQPLRDAGLIDRSMRVRLEGTAAKLDEVRTSLFGSRPPRADTEEHAGEGTIASVRARAAGLPIVGKVLGAAGLGVILAGFLVAMLAMWRSFGSARRSTTQMGYGAAGAILGGLVIGGLLVGVALEPQLMSARLVWALLVTFLLMAALFESFLYPLVIMFSVPLAMVGGLAALRLVHNWTMRTPTTAPQQLDILTMIGFVILIGVVVNNAILIVQQSLNFMNPGRVAGFAHERGMPPLRAISESVKTRCRPIFMTTFTTLGGGLPLVIAPGAGSEMYRGLGAVVVGGLFVSAFFTIVMVPLAFSLVLQMRQGFLAIFALRPSMDVDAGEHLPEYRRSAARPQPKPALEPAMSRTGDARAHGST